MTNWNRFIAWLGFGRVVAKEPMKTGWERASFYADDAIVSIAPDVWGCWGSMSKGEKLAALARRNDAIYAEIKRLQKNKKKFTHLLAEQRRVRNERMRIEGGV